jgi:hypothetical protein
VIAKVNFFAAFAIKGLEKMVFKIFIFNEVHKRVDKSVLSEINGGKALNFNFHKNMFYVDRNLMVF